MSDQDTPEQRKLARQVSAKIDAQLKSEASEMRDFDRKTLKLMLLGAGDSGKTTVLKQMRIIHGTGFNDQERVDFKATIQRNILESGKALVGALETLSISLSDTANELNAKAVRDYAEHITAADPLKKEVFNAIKALWNDRGIRECWKRSNEFLIQDTASYFMDRVEKFCEPNYLPNDQDILHTRFPTTGVSETRLTIDQIPFLIYDVGGQRNQRAFWAPYFQDKVHAILFVASLAAYDQKLVEDPTVNRMSDSLIVFDSVINNPLLRKISVVLFLNKADIFEKKLKRTPLANTFPDYRGVNEFKPAAAFIRTQFMKLDTSNGEKRIYSHYTTGTDTKHMKVILEVVRGIIVRSNIADTATRLPSHTRPPGSFEYLGLSAP
ncbi:guanine nucleotide binding protein, alpha subunit [Fimicolochytrium jonesii]|uniref:guanine nucleotide binding protein, alpha subunit n=1 Tax=Fimicolochytrium jonesii TaxID=1396493 RepID=UPI0022FE277C|nr:guanine nucleotide binding protein, alpha subunit [Fimicolochytrium jonesii]KAI8818258.1 guanine nucleotide binding protein, alpha subunit [Fimicolochytrium jonesii]